MRTPVTLPTDHAATATPGRREVDFLQEHHWVQLRLLNSTGTALGRAHSGGTSRMHRSARAGRRSRVEQASIQSRLIGLRCHDELPLRATDLHAISWALQRSASLAVLRQERNR
jgi:hypothetical protein